MLALSEDCSEADLVDRARERDPAAIRMIMQRYNRRLYRIARAILRNDSEAEDAVQSAYLHAFEALAGFRGDSSFATWITRIVMNEALTLARKRRAALTLSEDATQVLMAGHVIPFPTAANVDPERSMAQRQIQAALERAIDQLPEAFRVVLVARQIEGMSAEETAALLGLRVETVKTRLHRARRLLRLAVESEIGPLLLDAFPFAGARCARLASEVEERLGIAG